MLALAVFAALCTAVHDGPDPIAAWTFSPRYLKDQALVARIGPNATVNGNPKPGKTIMGECLILDGRADTFTVSEDLPTSLPMLPKQKFTVEAWVSVNTPEGYGGFLSVLQDNGNYEKGFVLGYTGEVFAFGLSTKGADDGNGKMTYLRGKTKFELGRFYHVVGTYDGKTMRIFVNGREEGSSTEQSGDILYPEKAHWVLGAYRDNDEHIRLHGRLASVALFDLVATPPAVEHLFSHRQALVTEDPVVEVNPNHEWVVEPYLQYPTPTEMTIMWETTRSSSAVVHFGPSKNELQRVEGKQGLIKQVRLTGLKPDSHYVYKVESVDDQGRKLESKLFTFRTAPTNRDRAIRFTVVGDTQENPHINKRIAEHMWNERPDFFMIVGDLVGTGANKRHWTDHFFGSMRPLLSRVPLIPVIGNHEGDARLYYDYMSVPSPEYWYRFTYGPAEFFIVDSNRNVAPGSEQWRWLESALASSRAQWKFVAHHHPPFSSDEDDYGNLWEGQSTRGDMRLRDLTRLYERHGVDIVWTGHIHSYERTWPLRNGLASRTGPIYIVCGGGGGGLETHGPTRPEFSLSVRHGHHYCVVSIHQGRLSFRAFDIEGRLFDTMEITKR